MGLKAVFFDLDDTLYTSFQAGDAYAYEKLEEWAISTFGDKGKGFADAFRVNRKRLPCRLRMTVCCLHRVHSSAWA